MTLVKRNNDTWFPSVFDDMIRADWMGGTMNSATPAVNVLEKDDSFRVELSAPGLKREDFEIELDNNLLTISSERSEENSDNEDGRFTRREFSFSTFKRSFTLPETIDAAGIKAEYVDGILKVYLPKREEAKKQPKRLIEIGE